MPNVNILPPNVFRVCPDAPTSTAPVRKPKAAKKKAPKKVRAAASDEFKICRGIEVLRICRGHVTREDLDKAAKCAKLMGFRAYTQSSCARKYLIEQKDLPIKHNVYITKIVSLPTPPAAPATPRVQKTKVFRTGCESTSTPPVRKAPKKGIPAAPVVKKESPAVKKQILDTAITCFKNGIAALEKLASKL